MRTLIALAAAAAVLATSGCMVPLHGRGWGRGGRTSQGNDGHPGNHGDRGDHDRGRDRDHDRDRDRD
ncbi:MAG: hypothetical protein IPO09_20420 [Anaeromyxobacter sp.]|nr:hypothetical protein [Anaeromyxobacter sp.]MBL0274844.1 hypothetical protein [Anaeromyxobacter sp.]